MRGDPVRNECWGGIPIALPLYGLPDGEWRGGLRCLRGAHRQSPRHKRRTCPFRSYGGRGPNQLTLFLPDLWHPRLGGAQGNGNGQRKRSRPRRPQSLPTSCQPHGRQRAGLVHTRRLAIHLSSGCLLLTRYRAECLSTDTICSHAAPQLIS